MKNFIQITGLLAFFLLLVLAFVFYNERAITFDTSYQLYTFVINKTFVHYIRIGALIPQAIPLSCIALHCSLRSVMLATSVGLVGLYFLLYFVIAFIWRQYQAALFFIITMLLLVNDTFYWIQSELPQGLAWLILYYAWLEKKGPADLRKRPVLHFILLGLLQFFHPLMIFPILFVLLSFLYKHYKYDLSVYLLPLGMAITIFFMRLYASGFDAYETAKLGEKITYPPQLLSSSIHYLHALFFHPHFYFIVIVVLGSIATDFLLRRNWPGTLLLTLLAGGLLLLAGIIHQLGIYSPAAAKLIHYAVTDYSGYWIIFLLTILMLAWAGQIFETALTVLFTLGYLLLITITNRAAEKFYLENLILPLGIFALLPFVSQISKQGFHFRKPVLLLLSLILLSRFYFIYNTHNLYTARLDWYEQKFREMDDMHTQRLMLTEKYVPMDTLVVSWSSGYESFILSSAAGPENSKSLVIDKDLNQYRNNFHADSIIQVKYGGWFDKDLPLRYFNMRRGCYIVQE